MDTKLVRHYIIILLFLLNISLFIFNLTNNDRYVVNSNQISIMNSYLQKNNISLNLNTELNKNFSPMPKITMKKTIYNHQDLLKIFFQDEINSNSLSVDDIEFTNDFMYNQKSVVITTNNLFFQNLNQKSSFEYSQESCLKIANYYSTLLSKQYGSLNLDLSFQRSDYYLFLYTQSDNKFKNFSNNLYIKVYAEGQVELHFSNYDKLEISSQNIDIYSIFEVLYIFSKEVPQLMDGEEIIIEHIDLGYYLKDKSENISLNFEPCYRIFTSNSEIPFFINAYTNTFEYDINFII